MPMGANTLHPIISFGMSLFSFLEMLRFMFSMKIHMYVLASLSLLFFMLVNQYCVVQRWGLHSNWYHHYRSLSNRNFYFVNCHLLKSGNENCNLPNYGFYHDQHNGDMFLPFILFHFIFLMLVFSFCSSVSPSKLVFSLKIKFDKNSSTPTHAKSMMQPY